MEKLVIDASVAMTWYYPDEHSDYAYKVLDALEHATAIVPAHWKLEITNAVIFGERRARLSGSDILRFFSLIDSLLIEVDPQTSMRSFRETLALARSYRLTAYDAAYLELAMREGLVLATADVPLRKAAEKVGVMAFKDLRG